MSSHPHITRPLAEFRAGISRSCISPMIPIAFRLKFPLRAGLLLVCACWLMTGSAPAQSLSDISGQKSSGQSGNLPNDRQETPAFNEILDSVGRSVTEELRYLIRPDKEKEESWDSNESPRDTTLTFINGMEDWLYGGRKKEDLERVRKTLPEGFEPDGPEARALKKIFDRLGKIPNINLPGKADIESEGLTQFELFPYALDHEWVWRAAGQSPRGTITLIKAEDGVEGWTFSEETLRGATSLLQSVADIPPIYQSSEDKNVIDRVFGPMFQDSPWWSWLILLGSLLLAVFLGRLVRNLLISAGRHLQSKVAVLLGELIRGLALSVGIVVGVVVVIIGTSYLEFSPLISEVVWMFVRIVLLVAFVAVLLSGIDLVASVIRRKFESNSSEYREMTVAMVQRILRSILLVVLVVFILESALGIHVGALLAGLGIIGLALSLAGKESAANLFGAVSIFINRPFVVGDWIEFNDALGEVCDVRMQATYVRLLSGEMMIIPNQQFVSKSVNNLGMRKHLRRELNVTLPYSTTPEQVDRAVELLNEILRSQEVVSRGKCNLADHPPIVSFDDFGDYYLNIKVYYWYLIGDTGEELERNHERGWFDYLAHCSIVNRAILKSFNENGIRFAFPTQTIELEKHAESGNQPPSHA